MQKLPMTIRAIADNSQITAINVGHSEDDVYRLDADATYFLKIGHNLRAEAERLKWLQGRLPVPEIVHFEIANGNHYLLTTAIAGKMLHEAPIPDGQKVRLIAEGARMWHSLPVDECPFDWTIEKQIAAARHNLDHQLVDEDDFEPHFYGKSATELFSDLLNAMPNHQDLRVTHGDFTMPNMLVDPQRQKITGFVDVGRMGVSDRHLDLVLASRSITYNCGGKWVMPFYQAYRLPLNPEKFLFYTLLDEFF